MLSLHFNDVNRSTLGSPDNSDNGVDSDMFKDKVTCMRNDRHYSALVYASYMNQFECFKAIFEHSLEFESRYAFRS